AATLFGALGVEGSSEEILPLDDLLATVETAPELRSIDVHKRRARYTLDGCMAELSEISADGHTTRTIAVELDEPERVIAAVRDLGLGDRANTCMARGLKALVGFE